MTLKQKLLSRIAYQDNGCWLYTGGWTRCGYGAIWDGKRQRRAHIISYEVHIGPIPDGKLVLHTCDNRWCVNPKHLFIGTYKDNADDMRDKGRDTYGENFGENNGQAKLTEDEVRQIRQLLFDNRHSQTEIGEMFGVTRGAIKCIKLGYTWRYLQ